eukprot:GGOE01005610.1.p1 GENE.GGOE01005610.1~~GGOE01005610.1.p1  ORF type:complete len:512 (+),score=96.38 GGOE01005610.1:53-1588(+)
MMWGPRLLITRGRQFHATCAVFVRQAPVSSCCRSPCKVQLLTLCSAPRRSWAQMPRLFSSRSGPPPKEAEGAAEGVPGGPGPHSVGSTTNQLVHDGVDPRAWPIVWSSLITGTAIGVILPLLPLFARSIGVCTTELGMLIGAVGLARLVFNIPAAWMAERYGRRPLLIGGPLLTSCGMVLTAASSTLMELLGTRFLVGIGGSCQISGAQLYLSDISTVANRARTMVPNMIAFNIGTLLGPAIGGYMAEAFGLLAPFYFVASALVLVTLNNVRLTETQHVLSPAAQGSVRDAFHHTLGQWRPLLSSKDMQTIMALHGIFLVICSGAQFTLMPLLAAERFGLGPSVIGMCFATMSAVAVAGAQPVAWVSDKCGRKSVIITGVAVISCALALMPVAWSYESFMAVVVLWGIGNTLLGGGPAAYVADLTQPSQRAQALALLRCAGDGGLMVGASLLGCVADLTTLDVGFRAASALLVACGASFAIHAMDIRHHPTPVPPARPSADSPSTTSPPSR